MTDVLAALLADEGYESFVPDANGLTAYVKEELFEHQALDKVIKSFPLETTMTESHSTVEGRDWNAEWEKIISSLSLSTTFASYTRRSTKTYRYADMTS